MVLSLLAVASAQADVYKAITIYSMIHFFDGDETEEDTDVDADAEPEITDGEKEETEDPV